MSIFDCYEARLHTLPDAPTLRAATHEQRVEHSDRMEALNADKIVPRFGTDPDPPYIDPDDPNFKDEFFAWGCHSMLLYEDYWQQCNLVWSWIDERPVCLSPVDWYLDILPNPEPQIPDVKNTALKTKVERRFRFTLLGGGQITVIERFKIWRFRTTDDWEFIRECQDLRITTDAGAGLKHFTGVIENTFSDMNAHAVLFRPGTPQSVADRVAATFRLLTYSNNVGSSVRAPDPENFAALLDRSVKCCVCDRPLRDHVSTLLGIGPNCAKQLRLPHSLDAANKILQRRRQLLGDAA